MKSYLFLLALILFVSCAEPEPTESGSAGNQSPVIQSLTASPPAITIGSSCTLTVEAFDPDSDPLTYQWSASAGDIIGQGVTVRYTASFCCTGSNRITVTVKDNRGGSASRSIDIEVYR